MSTRTLAVWKFASCDGCQLRLLDQRDGLLALARAVKIAYFPKVSRAVIAGPYDLSLVEGSISTPEDARRIRQIRAGSRHLVSIGACATAGGIQALRNAADAGAYAQAVYPNPDYIASLDTSTPVSDHVEVDFELQGCPVDGAQLVEVVSAFLTGRRPVVPRHPVCYECKAGGSCACSSPAESHVWVRSPGQGAVRLARPPAGAASAVSVPSRRAAKQRPSRAAWRRRRRHRPRFWRRCRRSIRPLRRYAGCSRSR